MSNHDDKMLFDKNGMSKGLSGSEMTDSRLINIDIEKEMKQSFLAYSMSVIVSRALPDVRDGLKPVHRRILYTLYEDGLGPDKAYRKCANTVGSVLGRYHPHGDASVYDALVRLAQDFSMRYTLVDGHGNFGSVDGDPPAAYRYTESRMSKIAVEMLTDIDKDTVDFSPNYDDRLKEPNVLPSRYPNLLVNGSTGIAVGMATNIPPHNLNEVIDGLCAFIDNPQIELSELMKYIKGPDFPTSGIIMGIGGIREAYSTGKGRIIVRAKAEIIEENKRFKIIVTELPYQVNKARLIETIANMVKEKKIDGISNIDDHSDRDGMCIKIDIKKDASPEIVLNKLYSLTQLQVTFAVVMLAIDNGEPKILTLRQILDKYLSFQTEVVTRRTQFELRKAQERAHILEGLKIALDFIDEVIKILRSSKSIAEGKSRLCERFGLDDVQAQAIVQMPLGKLTGLERQKIEEELNGLLLKIADLQDILANKVRILTIIKEELSVIKKRFGDERRTEIKLVSGEVDVEDLIPKEDFMLTFTRDGYFKRQRIDSFKLQHRGGKGVSAMTKKQEDIINEMFIANSHDNILLFSNLGKVYTLKCYEIPEGSRISKGTNIANLIQLAKNENITAMVKISEFKDDNYLIMVTKRGMIKRIASSAFINIRKNGLKALSLNPDDELNWVSTSDGSKDIIIATKLGKAIRFNESEIRISSRSTKGLHGIRFSDDDCVCGVVVTGSDNKILTISELGYGRISDVSAYNVQSHGGKGRLNYKVQKYGYVASINEVNFQNDLIIISSDGIIIRIPVNSITEHSKGSKGVRLMRMADGVKIVAVTCVPHDEDNPQTEEILDDETVIE